MSSPFPALGSMVMAAALAITPPVAAQRTTEGPESSNLWIAATRGDLEAVRDLLEEGAPVDGRDRLDRTPLALAARWGRIEVLGALLEAGADVTIADGEGRTPLHAAVEWAPPSALLEIVDLLLAAETPVDARDGRGRTPLLAVVMRGHAEAAAVVERLLAAGADTNVRDGQGRTSLHIAVAGKRQELAAELLEGGADPSLAIEGTTEGGVTALDLARRQQDPQLVELLERALATKEKAATGPQP